MRLVELKKAALIGLLTCTWNVRGEQGPAVGMPSNVENRVNTILSQLTLAQKLSYIGGTGFFDLKPIPQVAHFPGSLNPQIYQTDAGLGVRRNHPSVRFPSGLTLAATWNPTLAYDQGVGMGEDTRARGYFAIEGPGMDFYRVPLGGRNFEYLTGEDPFLGGQLAPQEVLGIQSQGVWASAKHYVCNDEEENRTNVNILVDERVLREIYLPPFETSVKVGHAATVMGAYNQVNGDWCCESQFLLEKVLKGDWGFPGILVSDYDAIHNGVKAAVAGCDVDLPSGSFMNATTLGDVIGAGLLPVSTIDDKVRRILHGVISFGFLDRQQLDPTIPQDNPYSEAVATQIAREGIVLLKNEGDLLPLSSGIRSIAVIGDYVKAAPPTGFGSSYVTPINWVSELDGIRSEAPAENTQVDYLSSCSLNPEETLWENVDKQGEIVQGLQGEYFASNDLSGLPAATRTDIRLNFEWTTAVSPVEGTIPIAEIPPAIPAANQASFSVRWTGQIRPAISGDQVFKLRADGGLRLFVNGQKLIDTFNKPPLPPVGYGPTPALSGKINLQAGRTYAVVIEYRRVGGFFNFFEEGGLQGIQASWASLQAPPDLAKYDAVVVSGGLSEEYEGEGLDREFQLPEFQDELIQNLSRVNPHTIVVLHGGGNFDSLSWINQVGAYLHTFYPGQNGGQALAEILFGDVNPSGRLPVTFERRIQDNPAYATFPKPVNQKPTEIAYSEGLYVGYRGYEKGHIAPLYPFGYGLSYTTFEFSGLQVKPVEFDGTTPVTVTFTVTNTGQRAGAEVAQLYVGQKNPSIDRPIKELKGFDKVYLQPGESKTVSLTLHQRSVAYWDKNAQKWVAPPGTYNVLVGDSSQDIKLSGTFSLANELTANP
ncbi:MAG TPA: glycoside hydrolase family 3 C-terminal domain-containing protein [Chthoniobacterales bacterium]